MKSAMLDVSGYDVLVDAEDVPILLESRWHLSNGYVARKDGKTSIYMHRELTSAPKGMVVDHINHNKLDNRKANLRVVSSRTNGLNRKNRRHLPGVHRQPGRKYPFRSSITIGYFQTEEEAHQAWRSAYVRLFDEEPNLLPDAVTLLLQQEKGELPV